MPPESILITGAGGFLGRHLRQALDECNIGVVHAPTRQELDLVNGPQVRSYLERIRPTIVVHLAALTDRSQNWECLPRLTEINVYGTAQLIGAVAAFAPRVMLHVGTIDEYGPQEGDFVETMSPRPTYAYAASKLAAGALWKAAGGVHLRTGILYGPGCSEKSFIGDLVRAFRTQQRLPMTAGEQRRDFLHIQDFVKAVLAFLHCPAARGLDINVTSGQGCSLRDIVHMAEQATGLKRLADMGANPYRAGEVFYSVGSHARATSLTGWEPRISIVAGLTDLLKNP